LLYFVSFFTPLLSNMLHILLIYLIYHLGLYHLIPMSLYLLIPGLRPRCSINTHGETWMNGSCVILTMCSTPLGEETRRKHSHLCDSGYMRCPAQTNHWLQNVD
jgi:hypothetical protein